MQYFKGTNPFMFAPPSVKLMALGGLPAVLGLLAYMLWEMLCELQVTIFGIDAFLGRLHKGFIILAVVMEAAGVVLYVMMPDAKRIKYMLQKRLFSSKFGNPFSLKEGEVLPDIKVIPENKEKKVIKLQLQQHHVMWKTYRTIL